MIKRGEPMWFEMLVLKVLFFLLAVALPIGTVVWFLWGVFEFWKSS